MLEREREKIRRTFFGMRVGAATSTSTSIGTSASTSTSNAVSFQKASVEQTWLLLCMPLVLAQFLGRWMLAGFEAT